MKISATLRRLALISAIALSTGVMSGQMAQAQNLFAPAARINDTVVTEFEVQQRQRFLQLLNAPGSNRDAALQGLIDDRLRGMAIAESGIELSKDGLQQGLAEFASRANLTVDEFTSALEQSGVSPETLRDFVSNSLEWRELVRTRYARQSTVSQDEIDRAVGNTRSTGAGLRLLLSEIIIPAPPQRAAEVIALAERIAQSQSEAEFSGYAVKYSATASRGNGGRMPWTSIEDLPPSLHPLLLALGPGDVTAPLPIPNAIALFQLRGIEETGTPAKVYSAIEYAAYYLPGGRSETTLAQAASLRNELDVCDDLYGVAKGQPEEVLERETKAPADIPRDIAFELSKLDPGEVSTTLTRANGQTLMFLMLCKRTADVNALATPEDVISALRQRKLQGFADIYMEQLRADARILMQ